MNQLVMNWWFGARWFGILHLNGDFSKTWWWVLYSTCILESRRFCLGAHFLKHGFHPLVKGNAEKHPQIILTGNFTTWIFERPGKASPRKIHILGGSRHHCFSHRPLEGVKIYFQLWGWTKQPPPTFEPRKTLYWLFNRDPYFIISWFYEIITT